MSPELGAVLLVTILYGPLALWLIYRAFRGPRVRFHQPFNAVSPGVPGMADGIARSSGEAAGTTVAPASPRIAPPPPEILVHAPEHAWSVAPPEAPTGVPVCPFLGFRNDPSTRFDFPDPANRCHATSKRGVRSVAFPRRFVRGAAGARRSQPIGVEHQEARCLTAAHEQCARYLAVKTATAQQ